VDYNLVLRNGHVIDASQSINRVTDIAVRDGRIADIGESRPH
jgi:dihydroorotase